MTLGSVVAEILIFGIGIIGVVFGLWRILASVFESVSTPRLPFFRDYGEWDESVVTQFIGVFSGLVLFIIGLFFLLLGFAPVLY